VNIKEYISSGILEAYALGDLSDHERAEVEKNLALYPELKAELTKIEEAQEQFLMQTAQQPSSRVRENIFANINFPKAEDKEVVRMPDYRVNFWRYAAAASIAVAVVSSYFAFTYYNKYNAVSSDLNNLIAQYEQTAKNYNQVNEDLNELQTEIRVMDNPQFKRVIMTGTANAPEAMASVYWNERTQEVYLRIQNMKELAKENQYQLWAIVDGKPVDAGVFDSTIEGLLKMKNIGTGAVTFAVTIEPRGGKASPTLETMQVAGNI
jgi:anti-sigma-K factor RskA